MASQFSKGNGNRLNSTRMIPLTRQLVASSGDLLRRRNVMVALAIFAGLQFIPARRTNPPVSTDFIAAAAVPAAEARLLRAACYDCHSQETRWPWYARVAPASWWIARHVREGREHLNFSNWPQGRPWEAKAKLESIAEALRNDSMPPGGYKLLHADAKLTSAQRLRLGAEVQTEAAALRLPSPPGGLSGIR